MTMSPKPQTDSARNPPSLDSRVGVTIITGFLGSGKSTLIHRILTTNHGQRLVVVENEFSPTGSVEEAIVTQGSGASALHNFIELPNGCICCAAQDDLTDSLARLLRARPGSVDHVLVEASGLADPGPVAASFWVDEEMETGLVLDAVVTVADARNVERYLMEEGGKSERAVITQKQLAVADLVLLNKVDLVGEGEGGCAEAIARVEETIRGVGCSARIIRTVKCDVDLAELMNVRAYDAESSARQLCSVQPAKFANHVHTGVSAVGTVTVTFKECSFDPSMLERALGELLWENAEDPENESDSPSSTPQEIWRMKALVAVSDEQVKQIYQSVHTLFDSSPSNLDKEMNDGESLFVFIGKGLQLETLRRVLGRAVE